MTKLAASFNPEHVETLDVEGQYQEAIRVLENTHAKLAELPQNPYAPTESLNAMKERMGVEENKNDFSMFMAGGAESFATGLLASSAGLSGLAATALEVGAAMMSEKLSEDKDAKTTFKRLASTDPKSAQKNSVFMAPKPKGTVKRAPKQVAQTSFVKRAQLKQQRAAQFRAYMAKKQEISLHQKVLKDLDPVFKNLNTLKRQGISTVSRNENGKVINAQATPMNARYVHRQDQEVNDMAARLAAVHGVNHQRAAQWLRPQMSMR